MQKLRFYPFLNPAGARRDDEFFEPPKNRPGEIKNWARVRGPRARVAKFSIHRLKFPDSEGI